LSPLTALIPAAASAATSLAKSAAHGIAEGFSFAAELAKGSRDDAASADSSTSPSLPPALQKAIDDFAKLIRQRLATAGIDLAGPLELRGDGLGGLEIDRAHPLAEHIESLLNADPLLTAEFHDLAARLEQTMVGPDPLASSLPWDQSAGRLLALSIGPDGTAVIGRPN
jgi:hypothetical protein